MKYRTTQKAVKAGYNNLIVVPYCDLQNLLDYREATAYTAGVYGWNADIYDINGYTAIVTGYRPFGNIRAGYEICRRYDQQAREIVNEYRHPNETYEGMIQRKQTALQDLLDQFIKEVLEK